MELDKLDGDQAVYQAATSEPERSALALDLERELDRRDSEPGSSSVESLYRRVAAVDSRPVCSPAVLNAGGGAMLWCSHATLSRRGAPRFESGRLLSR